MINSVERDWKLPNPVAVHEIQVDAETCISLRRHGNPDGPRLVLSHGNGLAIDLYYPFWSQLTESFDLVVYDLRSHGWNAKSALERHNVPTLVSDHDVLVHAIDQIWGVKPKVGVFHSVSALVSLLSPTRGSCYSALILFDPPVCKPGRDHREYEVAAVRTASFARRRQERFVRREDFTEVLSRSVAFQYLVPGTFDLMARTTLRELDDGTGYELCCPREYEARMIDYASVYGVAVDFGTMKCPVKVIGADPTMQFSYLPTLDMSNVMSVDYDFLPETTHFLQLEQPGKCSDAVRTYLDSILFG